MANAFYNVWVDCLLYKLVVLNFPSYLLKPSLSTLIVGR